ncbi:meteorin-like protein [Oppia nitens]|uniref:meteorin-like protein n=1 Tax=Oppia nitens TaxID=1686743 RepID=UPI0023DB9194|nr:meteorin-like protein [Oppia nitens]
MITTMKLSSCCVLTYYKTMSAIVWMTLLLIPSIKCLPVSYTALNYQQISDVCDWEGSGSIETDSDRVIVPVYLRCSHGIVKWLYPKGGLRVVLKHGTSDKEFRGCIRVARNTSKSVRMYVEGNQQLHKLYAFDDNKDIDLLRCFVSNNGKIAIFVESEPSLSNDLIYKDFVKFSYDLQSVSSKEELITDDEECKPCDDNQLLSQYCTSDFIIEGSINSLFHNKPLERSEVTVRAHRVIKDPVDNTYQTLGHNNSVSVDAIISQYGIVKHYTIYRPLRCRTKAGSGTEFLFIGRWLLGSPVISCAPKLEHWKHVKSKALESGTNECQLF